jgi:hypothetical protein
MHLFEQTPDPLYVILCIDVDTLQSVFAAAAAAAAVAAGVGGWQCCAAAAR